MAAEIEVAPVEIDAAGPRAARADTAEAHPLNLARVAGAKGHGEMAEHLLVLEVLQRQRPLAGVHRLVAAAARLLGLLLLALVAVGIAVARAKGEDFGEGRGGRGGLVQRRRVARSRRRRDCCCVAVRLGHGIRRVGLVQGTTDAVSDRHCACVCRIAANDTGDLTILCRGQQSALPQLCLGLLLLLLSVGGDEDIVGSSGSDNGQAEGVGGRVI